MGMTITEKILADHAGKKDVHPGELIDCRLDLLMQGDDLELNPTTGEIRNVTRDETYRANPLPPFAQKIMAAGGLMKYVAKKKGLAGRLA